VILVDTSAWIEFLRNSGSPVCNAVDDLLDDDLATCEVISMEILAGARDDTHLVGLRRLLARTRLLRITPADYDGAASLYRTCRLGGATPRSLVDCLIGSVALRTDAEILHADRDYTLLARQAPLRLHPRSLPPAP